MNTRVHRTWPTFTLLLILLISTLPIATSAAESVCFGASNRGRLEGGVKIPESGSNFSAYSGLGVSLGRTYVHAKVAEVIAAAYATLAIALPDTVFVYGESGWAGGGRIRPHRTHQNGLAVDFMVPVLNAEGRSVPLPAGLFNKFGYGIEFDGTGRYEDLRIDFEAIAEHLYAVYTAAQSQGVGIARVIFEPSYLPKLYHTRQGEFLKAHIVFMQGQAWIRHDEHYHIDFAVPCKPLQS